MLSRSTGLSVLVVHPRGIGDWIMFMPALRAIRAALPDSNIDVLVGTPATMGIVRQCPEVSHVHGMDVRSSPWSVIRAALRARAARYDVLVITDGVRLWKAKLFALISGAQRAVLPSSPSAHSDAKHRVLRNLAAVAKLGLGYLQDEEPRLPNSWGPHAKGSVLIHPGCDGKYSFKRWPAERFLSLANRLADEGCAVTILLGPSELDLSDLFLRGVNASVSVIVNKPLPEVLRELAHHEVCVTSDSGLGHVAAALGRPVITIFGPANQEVVRPFSKSAIVIRAHDDGLSCRPCMRLGGRMGCAERPCLIGIGIDEVYDAVRKAMTLTALATSNSVVTR